jgi:hypothetical protein
LLGIDNTLSEPAEKFSAVVSEPRFEFGEGPRVGVDSAHANHHTLVTRFLAFGQVLESDGYQVGDHPEALTADSLAQLDILVIANAREPHDGGKMSTPIPLSAFTPAEIRSVVDWLSNGGRLLLLADHAPFGAASKDLAEAIGVIMSDGFVIADKVLRPMIFDRTTGQLQGHPITDGHSNRERIERVVTLTGQALQLNHDYKPLLLFRKGCKLYPKQFSWVSASEAGVDVEGWAQGAAGKIGKGRVVVFGDAGLFMAGTNPNGATAGMSTPGTQNKQFLLNVMHWLGEDL